MRSRLARLCAQPHTAHFYIAQAFALLAEHDSAARTCGDVERLVYVEVAQMLTVMGDNEAAYQLLRQHKFDDDYVSPAVLSMFIQTSIALNKQAEAKRYALQVLKSDYCIGIPAQTANCWSLITLIAKPDGDTVPRLLQRVTDAAASREASEGVRRILNFAQALTLHADGKMQQAFATVNAALMLTAVPAPRNLLIYMLHWAANLAAELRLTKEAARLLGDAGRLKTASLSRLPLLKAAYFNNPDKQTQLDDVRRTAVRHLALGHTLTSSAKAMKCSIASLQRHLACARKLYDVPNNYLLVAKATQVGALEWDDCLTNQVCTENGSVEDV